MQSHVLLCRYPTNSHVVCGQVFPLMPHVMDFYHHFDNLWLNTACMETPFSILQFLDACSAALPLLGAEYGAFLLYYPHSWSSCTDVFFHHYR